MTKGRFSEEQITGVLRMTRRERRRPTCCRQHGISEATVYNWKAKYGGMTVSDARRLGAFEDENRRLKKLSAEVIFDNAALKDIASGNVWSAPSRCATERDGLICRTDSRSDRLPNGERVTFRMRPAAVLKQQHPH